MFSKLALLVAATMVIFVAAAPADGGINKSCNTGPVQCCRWLQYLWMRWVLILPAGNELYDSDSAKAKSYLFSLGLINVVAPISTKVGANCGPLSVIGLGKGSSWYVFSSSRRTSIFTYWNIASPFCSKSQPVCCNDNKFGKLRPSCWYISLTLIRHVGGLIAIGCSPVNINLWRELISGSTSSFAFVQLTTCYLIQKMTAPHLSIVNEDYRNETEITR